MPSATVRANARKTAISSVQGERRSSSSSARAVRVEVAPGGGEHLGRVGGGLRAGVDAADRAGRRLARRPSSATCAAGSVVVRWTGWPRRASSTAMAAATVVLPTPPLPIVMMSPRPARGELVDERRRGVARRERGAAAGGSMPVTARRRTARAARRAPTRRAGHAAARRRAAARASAPGSAASAAALRVPRAPSRARRRVGGAEDAVEDQPLACDAQLGQLAARLRSASASADGSGRRDQHDRRARRVSEGGAAAS